MHAVWRARGLVPESTPSADSQFFSSRFLMQLGIWPLALLVAMSADAKSCKTSWAIALKPNSRMGLSAL